MSRDEFESHNSANRGLNESAIKQIISINNSTKSLYNMYCKKFMYTNDKESTVQNCQGGGYGSHTSHMSDDGTLGFGYSGSSFSTEWSTALGTLSKE